MEGKGKHTTLIIALVVVIGLALLWLYSKGKKAQAASGSSGGVFGTLSAGLSGVMGITQNVTGASVQTGETLGGGIKAGAKGGLDIVHTAVHDSLPWNW